MGNLREQIAETNDESRTRITVPEWGNVDLEIRSMSAGDRAMMLNRIMDDNGKLKTQHLYPQMLIKTVYDPTDGQPVFKSDDTDLINSKNASVVERIATAAMQTSGISEDAIEEKKDDS